MERSGRPLTVTLLESGALERAVLEVELGKNLSARLEEVLEWRRGTYEFKEQPPNPVEIMPRLDLVALIERAWAERAREDDQRAEGGDAPDPSEGSPRKRLEDALEVARSIAKSTGKGRVDRPFGAEDDR
jgi:hypothetical protein